MNTHAYNISHHPTGVAQAVGLAMAGKHMAAVFNRENFDIVDNYVYCIVGDGCLQEGVASEACMCCGCFVCNPDYLSLGRVVGGCIIQYQKHLCS